MTYSSPWHLQIKERDGTIQDKEKRIYDLKKKNQELEKFKFVLDYKIKELKHQIEPRENEILAMTQQIKEMDVELEQYHTANNKLELAINDLRQKLHAAEKEVDNERNVVHEASAVVKGFKLELSQCMASIQDAKLLKVGQCTCVCQQFSTYFSSSLYIADQLERLVPPLLQGSCQGIHAGHKRSERVHAPA